MGSKNSSLDSKSYDSSQSQSSKNSGPEVILPVFVAFDANFQPHTLSNFPIKFTYSNMNKNEIYTDLKTFFFTMFNFLTSLEASATAKPQARFYNKSLSLLDYSANSIISNSVDLIRYNEEIQVQNRKKLFISENIKRLLGSKRFDGQNVLVVRVLSHKEYRMFVDACYYLKAGYTEETFPKLENDNKGIRHEHMAIRRLWELMKENSQFQRTVNRLEVMKNFNNMNFCVVDKFVHSVSAQYLGKMAGLAQISTEQCHDRMIELKTELSLEELRKQIETWHNESVQQVKNLKSEKSSFQKVIDSLLPTSTSAANDSVQQEIQEETTNAGGQLVGLKNMIIKNIPDNVPIKADLIRKVNAAQQYLSVGEQLGKKASSFVPEEVRKKVSHGISSFVKSLSSPPSSPNRRSPSRKRSKK